MHGGACALVHPACLTLTNDVTAQLFQQPAGAGCDAREQAVVPFLARLGLPPQGLAATNVAPRSALGRDPVEVLDLVRAVALFAWANRLMLNLGEAVLQSDAPGP